MQWPQSARLGALEHFGEFGAAGARRSCVPGACAAAFAGGDAFAVANAGGATNAHAQRISAFEADDFAQVHPSTGWRHALHDTDGIPYVAATVRSIATYASA